MASASGRSQREAGLTLVEILVSLGLGAGVTVAGMALAQVLARVNREQTDVQALTDNMRGALLQLTADVRLAGAGMSAGDAVNAATSSPAQVPAMRLTNSSTGPDQLELLTIPGSAIATTFASTTASSTVITVDQSNGAKFDVGDYALLTNYTNGVLYKVMSSAATTTSGIDAQALTVSAAPSFPVTEFAAGSLLLKANVLRYSVAMGTAVGLPTISTLLVNDGAPLGVSGTSSLAAENIYDLQVAVGIDGINGQASDGVITEVGAAANDDEWVYNTAGDTMPAAPFALRALRLTLIGRTPQVSQTIGTGRPAAEDRAAGAQDNFRWRLQREVIMVRNMVLQ